MMGSSSAGPAVEPVKRVQLALRARGPIPARPVNRRSGAVRCRSVIRDTRDPGISRSGRSAVSAAGSSARLEADGGGCDHGAPGGYLVPPVREPPNFIPGLANFYSAAGVVDGSASGVVVTHQMGRPIKIEGNPHHSGGSGS